VAKINIVCVFLAMVAICHYGDMEKEIYMEQPRGFVANGKSGLICKLHQSLYGLKQSSRA